MDIYFYTSCSLFAMIALYALLLLLVYISLPRKEPVIFKGKHALISGGSKGIGKAIATALIERGCSVTLLARNMEHLENACKELNGLAKSMKVPAVARYYDCDVTCDYEVLKAVVDKAEEELGNIDILVNNAGYAAQGAFETLDITIFEEQLRLNYLSAVYLTRAVLPKMKASRKGHIVFVSSAAGQCSVWGYTAYGATKFAMRGFAEALHMELLPYNIHVSVIYPPDTNTEGYKEALRTMPEELREICKTAGLFDPELVAERLINDLSHGNYNTSIGLEGQMLSILSAGGAPEKNFWQAAAQVLFGGMFRAIMLIYIGRFNKIVEKHKCKRSH